MRFLGLDFAQKKIGLAISDELGMIASWWGFIENQSWLYAVNRIKELVKEKNITQIIMCVPINLKGEIGKKGAIALEFTSFLKENIDVPIISWEERFSSKVVMKAIAKQSKRKKKKTNQVDKLTAQWILQGYLDKHRYEIEDELY